MRKVNEARAEQAKGLTKAELITKAKAKTLNFEETVEYLIRVRGIWRKDAIDHASGPPKAIQLSARQKEEQAKTLSIEELRAGRKAQTLNFEESVEFLVRLRGMWRKDAIHHLNGPPVHTLDPINFGGENEAHLAYVERLRREARAEGAKKRKLRQTDKPKSLKAPKTNAPNAKKPKT